MLLFDIFPCDASIASCSSFASCSPIARYTSRSAGGISSTYSGVNPYRLTSNQMSMNIDRRLSL